MARQPGRANGDWTKGRHQDSNKIVNVTLYADFGKSGICPVHRPFVVGASEDMEFELVVVKVKSKVAAL